MQSTGRVISQMIEYYAGDTRRIQHFLKVYAFAKAIGEVEQIPPHTQELLEVAAIVHDIGIKVSEEKYHSSAGSHQQIEGPPVAKKLLSGLEYEKDFIDRVCFLIAHHHTYNRIEGLDYQILVEADFLVNISEDSMPAEAVASVKEKIFRTQTGLNYLSQMYQV